MNDDDILILDRHLDGELSTQERGALALRLKGDGEFRAAVADELRLHASIALAIQPPGEAVEFRQRLALRLPPSGPAIRSDDQPPSASGALRPGGPSTAAHRRPRPHAPRGAPRPRPRWRLTAAVALAASLAISALATWFLATRAPGAEAALATISESSGSAQLVAVGEPPRAAVAGAVLHRADHLVTAAGGDVRLQFADGTAVAINEESEVTIDDDQGAKRVGLARGSIAATVARQPPGMPMRFRTPQAIVTVLGTRLTIAVAALTRVAVSEGRVALTPLEAASAEVTLASGEAASASPRSAAIEPRDGRDGPRPDQLWQQAVAAAVTPTRQEQAWDDIPWQTDLWSARRAAVAAGKPLLLWIGQGHPLGMAYSDCLVDRAVAWADPDIRRQVSAGFVPFAGDGWFLSRRQDAVGRYFAAIIAQAHATHPNTIAQGVFCVSSDGALLSQCSCGSDLGRLREVLAAGLRGFAGAPAPRPVADPGELDARHDPRPPPGALVLVAYARHLIGDGGAFRPAPEAGAAASAAAAIAEGREYLWLSPEEWHLLVAQHQHGGGSWSIPEALSRKLVRFGLLDTTHGEAMPWEAGDILSLRLSVSGEQDDGGIRRLSLDGQVRLASDARSYQARLGGHLDYDASRDAITAFDLAALGTHHGEEIAAADVGDALLGIDLRLAPLVRPAVAPHGVRDEGYYLPSAPSPK
jgi:hypothetical protein